MAGTIFEQLSNEAEGRELSVRWYRSKINDLAPRITAGEMLAQGKTNLQAPWLGVTVFVTLALILSLLIFIGEAVRDAFDPRRILK